MPKYVRSAKPFFFLVAFVVILCKSDAARAEDRPNVLWIYLEDVSGWFSCYGDKLIDTPNIDALADRGIRFDRFYTPAGVCSATRSAVITGMMQTSINAHHHRSSRAMFRRQSLGAEFDANYLPDNVKTIPELFRSAGYYTFNEGGGKDDFNFVWDPELLYHHRGRRWNFKGANNGSEWTGRDKDQPFFGQIQLAGGKLGNKVPKKISRDHVPVPPYYPDIPLVREEIAHHYDCLLETDRHVGQIIAALKRDNLFDNTIIFLFSDHGYKLHRHKQFLYEGGIQMPLIVAGPGIESGKVRDDLISGIDLGATSLAAVDLPIPEVMEGRDFLAKDYQTREFVIAARDRCDFTIERIRAVVTPRFKYLRNYLTDRPFMQPSYKDPWPVSQKFREMMANGEMNETQLVFFGPQKPAEEIYDLTNDPHEIHNLATNPRFANELEKHRKILADWIERTGDRGQEVESDAALLAALKRWQDKCVNPEYDRVRETYNEWKQRQSHPGPKAGTGIMVGELTTSSAVVQLRLSESDQLVKRDLPGAKGVVEFTLHNENGEKQKKLATAEEHHDFIARVVFENLQAGRKYQCTTRIGSDSNQLNDGPIAQFKTHPGPDSDDEVSFVVVTGMNYAKFHGDNRIDREIHRKHNNTDLPRPYSATDKHLGYPALDAIWNLKPNFFVGTGDNVYYDTPKQPRAKTAKEMRQKWHEQFVQPRYHRLFADVPTYWMIDDHDYRIDDCDNSGDYAPSPQLGHRLMLEQLPFAPHESTNALTYRTRRLNRHLQVWFPENRLYRSPNLTPDTPSKTIWGAAQKAWLKQTLKESDATFKLLVSPTPMVGPDDARKKDNHTNIAGFQSERNEFFAWLKETGIDKRFAIVCGDRHWQYHSRHPSGIEEFSCGALVDANSRPGRSPGDPQSTDPSGSIKQLYSQEKPSGGFLFVKISPTDDNMASLSLSHYDERGRLLYNHQKVRPKD